jgi:hypothetical protein
VRVPLPLINVGPVGPNDADTRNLNVIESYSINLTRGSRGNGPKAPITNAVTGSEVFRKPVDRIGDKSIADYATYAGNHVYDIDIPGCGMNGRVFVGQRREGFVVNLAEAFDLINLNPLGPVDGEENVLADKEHHLAGARGPDQLPDKRQGSRDRRVDDGQPRHVAVQMESRPGEVVPACRPRQLYAGVPPGDAAGQRAGDRHPRQG